MSALEQLLMQYREKSNIKPSRKRPRDQTVDGGNFVQERNTKNCQKKSTTPSSKSDSKTTAVK